VRVDVHRLHLLLEDCLLHRDILPMKFVSSEVVVQHGWKRVMLKENPMVEVEKPLNVLPKKKKNQWWWHDRALLRLVDLTTKAMTEENHRNSHRNIHSHFGKDQMCWCCRCKERTGII
jgi:hypothetical protein